MKDVIPEHLLSLLSENTAAAGVVSIPSHTFPVRRRRKGPRRLAAARRWGREARRGHITVDGTFVGRKG